MIYNKPWQRDVQNIFYVGLVQQVNFGSSWLNIPIIFNDLLHYTVHSVRNGKSRTFSGVVVSDGTGRNISVRCSTQVVYGDGCAACHVEAERLVIYINPVGDLGVTTVPA